MWCPYTNCNIHKLEIVQHRAARFMTDNYSCLVSVSAILHNLNLPTLEIGRKNLKLVMMHKMIHGQVQVESGNYLI